MSAPTKRLDGGTCECGRAPGQCIKADDGTCDAPMPGDWVECWQCGGSGEGEHDCMDDTCCCLHPNVGTCDECKGAGGWRAK